MRSWVEILPPGYPRWQGLLARVPRLKVTGLYTAVPEDGRVIVAVGRPRTGRETFV